MSYLATSVALLTRIPIPFRWTGGAEAVGKSSRWFPLVGLLIGAAYLAVFKLASIVFPPMVAAVLVVVAEAFLTGALHMDGLADMADGFGGGHTRDDVLRIMRDQVIGSYGAVALLLTLALKIAQSANSHKRIAPIPGYCSHHAWRVGRLRSQAIDFHAQAEPASFQNTLDSPRLYSPRLCPWAPPSCLADGVAWPVGCS